MTEQLGPLLGVFEKATFREQSVVMTHGDAIVFFTAGATDLPPPNSLSDDELLAMVSEAVTSTDAAQAAIEQLSECLDQRTPFRRRHDAVALLMLRAR